jgi:alkanesulfonate monooxygenase
MAIEIFSTCAQSADHTPQDYARHVSDVARWSEEAGCTGMLVYTDNRLTDAWLVAQIALQATKRLCPLVAIQPAYMHPYTVANMIASYGFLHGRRIYLNMVAGGFKSDLKALNDATPHDQRYARLVEYTTIIQELLRRSSAGSPFSFDGEFYRVENLKLTPPLPAELMPGIFLSGSSAAGLGAVNALGATGIQYPRPVECYDEPLPADGPAFGIRIGIVTRPESRAAWEIAEQRFPEDRKGQLTHQLAMKVSDSEWHRQLSDLGASTSDANPYWLRPFENYKTMCPYLVGDTDRVATEIARYIQLGYRTFILDIPSDAEELRHTSAVFRRAEELAATDGPGA